MSFENIESVQVDSNNSSNILFRAVTFTLNEQLYALNILQLRDIIIGKQIYRIPNSDKNLIGVTNIRGEILPVYSLKNILGLEEKITLEKFPVLVDVEEDEYLIVIKYEDFVFAIVADYIDKNITVDSQSYNDSAYMTQWSHDTIFSGIIMDQDDNILLIDASLLVKNFVNQLKNINSEKA